MNFLGLSGKTRKRALEPFLFVQDRHDDADALGARAIRNFDALLLFEPEQSRTPKSFYCAYGLALAPRNVSHVLSAATRLSVKRLSLGFGSISGDLARKPGQASKTF